MGMLSEMMKAEFGEESELVVWQRWLDHIWFDVKSMVDKYG